MPFGGFAEAAAVALARHGPALARYNLGGSPQGHLPLREFIAAALDRRASMPTDPSEVLVTSGSFAGRSTSSTPRCWPPATRWWWRRQPMPGR